VPKEGPFAGKLNEKAVDGVPTDVAGPLGLAKTGLGRSALAENEGAGGIRGSAAKEKTGFGGCESLIGATLGVGAATGASASIMASSSAASVSESASSRGTCRVSFRGVYPKNVEMRVPKDAKMLPLVCETKMPRFRSLKTHGFVVATNRRHLLVVLGSSPSSGRPRVASSNPIRRQSFSSRLPRTDSRFVHFWEMM
jgi:hypothetical protein